MKLIGSGRPRRVFRVERGHGPTVGESCETLTVNSAPETQLVSLSLDCLDPAVVRVDPSAGLVSPLITHCLAVIAAAVPHPGDTRLVISGDFVSSVKDRLAPGPYRDSYSTDRIDGSVGGKTLRLADGTIDIVMPSVVSEAADDEETNEFRAVLAIRTVTHEAQHVAMYQAEEAETDSYDDQPWARQNFLRAATRSSTSTGRGPRSNRTFEAPSANGTPSISSRGCAAT